MQKEKRKNIKTSRCENKPKGYSTKNLVDMHTDLHYQEMFNEMMRLAHHSREKSDEEDRLRRIVGEDNFQVLRGGISRRRVGSPLQSRSARRRARSQAVRREKLNSQGLRSHLNHIRRGQDTYEHVAYD